MKNQMMLSMVLLGVQAVLGQNQATVPGGLTRVTASDAPYIQEAANAILNTMASSAKIVDGCSTRTQINIQDVTKQVVSGTVYNCVYLTTYSFICDNLTQTPQPYTQQCTASVWFKPDNSHEYAKGKEPRCVA